MNKLQQALTNVMDTPGWRKNCIDLGQCRDKCWESGLQQVWEGSLQFLTAILLLQATKEPGQLLLGRCLTFSDQRCDFRTRKPGCKAKRQQFLLWLGKRLKKPPDQGHAFL